MCKKCLYRLILLLGLAALSLAIVAAQTSEALIVKTADAALDESRVQEAAAPLIDRGARVALYFVLAGEKDDFLARLQNDRLGDGRRADHDVIALYVATENRYSEIRWGQDYNHLLEPVGRDLRSTRLNPGLRQGDYTAAFVNALAGIDEALAGTYVASGASGSSSSTPAIDSDQIIPIALIIFLIGSWLYCLATGRCKSSGSSYSDSGSSDFSSSSSNSGGSSGGSDGGSWDD